MQKRNLRAYNLNALPALREILRYGSLTKAAAALNLTQPALSNILKQLRNDFNDDLVVRRGKGMQLTPRGEDLLAPLEKTLASIERLLQVSEFDPALSNKRFRIATTDHVMSVIAGPIMSLLIKTAPEVSIQFLTAQISSINDLVVGDIDMIISPQILLGSGLMDDSVVEQASFEPLFSENLVCIGRNDDEKLSAGLSISEYLARPHVGYHFGDARLSSLEQIQLSRLSLKQNNKLFVSSYAVLPCVVSESGCLALVPESMARRAQLMCPVQIVKPQIDMPKMTWVMAWHNRNDDHPAILWLRNALQGCIVQSTANTTSPNLTPSPSREPSLVNA
jgi:LysR family transcriptional regulator, nod-box dependent transcriptional activator